MRELITVLPVSNSSAQSKENLASRQRMPLPYSKCSAKTSGWVNWSNSWGSNAYGQAKKIGTGVGALKVIDFSTNDFISNDQRSHVITNTLTGDPELQKQPVGLRTFRFGTFSKAGQKISPCVRHDRRELEAEAGNWWPSHGQLFSQCAMALRNEEVRP